MPGIQRFILLTSALLLLSLFSTSCIRVGDISSNAMRYNEAIEEAQNKMLLLNVVRAKSARPMYITDISKITGHIKLDLNTGGLETDYGRGLGVLTGGRLAPSLDYAHDPTFDVSVLSQQDFMQGFLKPSKDLFAYYWEQRWEQELLLYLFVHQVVIRTIDDTTKPEEIYVNYPRSAKDGTPTQEFSGFGQWVTNFVKQRPTFVRKDAGIGPCLDSTQIGDLDDLVAVAHEGLTVKKVETGKYQLQQAKPELRLVTADDVGRAREVDAICKRVKAGNKESKAGKESKESELTLDEAAKQAVVKCRQIENTASDKARQPIGLICTYREQILSAIQKSKFTCPPLPCSGEEGGSEAVDLLSVTYNEGDVKKEVTLYFRSPESILYYLGELMRLEERTGIIPEICVDGRLEPLFVAFARRRLDGSASECSAAVAVQYGGREFIIPDERRDTPCDSLCDPDPDSKCSGHAPGKYLPAADNPGCFSGQSMHALSLLNQLIALQKSAKDTPTTSVIRAISQ